MIALDLALKVAGGLTLIVVAASAALPSVLDWKEETARLRPLNRQVFWTYAGYIFATNLFLALISLFGTNLLLDDSPLAFLVSGYIFAYWGARLILQFVEFDRSDKPEGRFFVFAEWGFNLVFIYLGAVYTWLFLSKII